MVIFESLYKLSAIFMETLFFIGRVLFGGYFLYNAYNHLVKTKGLVGYAESKGVPQPRLAVIASGLLLLFGGYTVIAGVRVEAGIAALALFLIPVTFTMHAFWKLQGAERASESVQFWKNMALLGAALMLLAVPTPWPISLG